MYRKLISEPMYLQVTILVQWPLRGMHFHVLGRRALNPLLVVVKKSDLWEARKAKLYADPGSTQP